MYYNFYKSNILETLDMRFLLFFFLFLLLSENLFASAKVCKKGDTLEVKAELRFYGSKANLGAACAQEISSMFNRPDGKLKIGEKEYNVKFNISYRTVTEEQAFGSSTINFSAENNYIRIEDKAYNEKDGRSNNQISQNCGFYSGADGLGTSTTCVHEFAHGLGLIHYNDRRENKSKSMGGMDLRGTGQPGIMAARGFIVDPEFQYNPNAKAGQPGGTINPNLRKVNWQDILDLKMDQLTYDSAGCSQLGRATQTTYQGDGSTEWQGWSTTIEAMKYLLSGKLGSPPVTCHQ